MQLDRRMKWLIAVVIAALEQSSNVSDVVDGGGVPRTWTAGGEAREGGDVSASLEYSWEIWFASGPSLDLRAELVSSLVVRIIFRGLSSSMSTGRARLEMLAPARSVFSRLSCMTPYSFTSSLSGIVGPDVSTLEAESAESTPFLTARGPAVGFANIIVIIAREVGALPDLTIGVLCHKVCRFVHFCR